MASSNRWLGTLTGALLCVSSGLPATTSFAQQSDAQPPAVPRDDPATSGAWSDLRARRASSIMTGRKGSPPPSTELRGDDRSTHPKADDAKVTRKPPLHQGNDSMGTDR